MDSPRVEILKEEETSSSLPQEQPKLPEVENKEATKREETEKVVSLHKRHERAIERTTDLIAVWKKEREASVQTIKELKAALVKTRGVPVVAQKEIKMHIPKEVDRHRTGQMLKSSNNFNFQTMIPEPTDKSDDTIQGPQEPVVEQQPEEAEKPQQNYYEILGVDANTKKSEIRRIYKQKIGEYEGNEVTLALLKDAFNTLADSKKRSEYNESLAKKKPQQDSEDKERLFAAFKRVGLKVPQTHNEFAKAFEDYTASEAGATEKIAMEKVLDRLYNDENGSARSDDQLEALFSGNNNIEEIKLNSQNVSETNPNTTEQAPTTGPEAAPLAPQTGEDSEIQMKEIDEVLEKGFAQQPQEQNPPEIVTGEINAGGRVSLNEFKSDQARRNNPDVYSQTVVSKSRLEPQLKSNNPIFDAPAEQIVNGARLDVGLDSGVPQTEVKPVAEAKTQDSSIGEAAPKPAPKEARSQNLSEEDAGEYENFPELSDKEMKDIESARAIKQAEEDQEKTENKEIAENLNLTRSEMIAEKNRRVAERAKKLEPKLEEYLQPEDIRAAEEALAAKTEQPEAATEIVNGDPFEKIAAARPIAEAAKRRLGEIKKELAEAKENGDHKSEGALRQEAARIYEALTGESLDKKSDANAESLLGGELKMRIFRGPEIQRYAKERLALALDKDKETQRNLAAKRFNTRITDRQAKKMGFCADEQCKTVDYDKIIDYLEEQRKDLCPEMSQEAFFEAINRGYHVEKMRRAGTFKKIVSFGWRAYRSVSVPVDSSEFDKTFTKKGFENLQQEMEDRVKSREGKIKTKTTQEVQKTITKGQRRFAKTKDFFAENAINGIAEETERDGKEEESRLAEVIGKAEDLKGLYNILKNNGSGYKADAQKLMDKKTRNALRNVAREYIREGDNGTIQVTETRIPRFSSRAITEEVVRLLNKEVSEHLEKRVAKAKSKRKKGAA